MAIGNVIYSILTNEQKQKINILKTLGDGQKLLSDDGSYKELINDLKVPSLQYTYSAKKIEERLNDIKNMLISSKEDDVRLLVKNSLNVKNGEAITFTTYDNSNVGKAVVQCYKFIAGKSGIVQIIKNFNNSEKENFYYSKNVEFDGVAKIKKVYKYNNKLNNDGLYESETINLKEYLNLHDLR